MDFDQAWYILRGVWNTKFGQNPLKDSRVFTRMLRKDGRTDGSVTISHRNFVGEGINSSYIITELFRTSNTLQTKKNCEFM
jgi:hypothetical protein